MPKSVMNTVKASSKGRKKTFAYETDSRPSRRDRAKKREQNKRWRENNPDYNKAYVEAHREKINSYGREYREENKEVINKNQRKRYNSAPEKRLLSGCKARAKKNGLEFDLELDDIVVPSHCPVLGIPIFFSPCGKGRQAPRPNSPSVDRIDNMLGYTKDNIIIVSHRANTIKNDATIDELNKVAAFYSSLTGRCVE